ncbi:MAG: hypothetical protein ACREIL_02335, partial [Nitrospiraceae bacterium]
PTPWNQLEAGVLFAIGVPLLVLREEGIAGGIFDRGVTDLFIHKMPTARLARAQRRELREILRKWAADVHSSYYS